MLPHNFSWIIKLVILLITVQFSTNQKYGYYLTSTYNITTSSKTILSSSELLYDISQIAKNYSIEIRGTILNIRNNNITGDIFFIIYSKETSLNGFITILTNLSYKLKDMVLYNTNVYLLYFVELDVEFLKNEKNLNTSSTEYMEFLNKILSSPEMNSIGIQLFDPPIPTFNKLFVSFRNKSGNYRGTIFATVYSLINQTSSTQMSISFPYYLPNFNATIHQGCWDKLSMYSTTGNSAYEFYFTTTIKLSQSIMASFSSEGELIGFINKIYSNLSNVLLTYGIGLSGEILNINNASFTIDCHGSLFRGIEDLNEMNYIVSKALSTVSNVTFSFTNSKIYHIYKASIYSYLDNNIYNLNNSSNLQMNLENKIISGLKQENMFVIKKIYFDFMEIFQWRTFENRIRAIIQLLIYTEKSNLLDVENRILKIFVSLPSIVDPFNSHVGRAENITTGTYQNCSIRSVIYNMSTVSYRTKEIVETSNERLTTIFFSTTTAKEPTTSTSTTQTTTTKEPATSTLTTQTTTTKEPTTSTSTTTTTTTKEPTTSTLTTQTTTTKEHTTSTSTTQTTTTKLPTTSTSTIKTTTTVKQIQVGDTVAKVDLTCKLQEDFKDTYSDKDSDDYKSFTNKMTEDIENSFKKQGNLRLQSVIYNKISKGSVIVNLTLSTASSSSMNSNQITDNIRQIASSALGPNATIENLSVKSIEIVTSAAPNTSTKSPESDIWKVAVGVLFGIIGIVGIICIVLYFLGYFTKSGKLDFYNEI